MNECRPKATRLTVSLEEHENRMLNEIALARDASVFWVIRQFIEETLRPTDQPPSVMRASKPDG